MPEQNKNKLITTAYTAGSSKYKQIGFSLLYEGERVSKDDPCMAVSALVEHVRSEITNVLNHQQQEQKSSSCYLDYKDVEFLGWLRRNLFSLSSFVYMKGNTDKHVIPSSALEFIKERKEYFKQHIDPRTDFLFQSEEVLNALDNLRIWVRDLERVYVGYHYDPRSVSARETLFAKALSSEDDVELQKSLNRYRNQFKTVDFLNLLSDYVFYLIRYQAKMMGVEELEWQNCGGEIEEFPYSAN